MGCTGILSIVFLAADSCCAMAFPFSNKADYKVLTGRNTAEREADISTQIDELQPICSIAHSVICVNIAFCHLAEQAGSAQA